MWRVGLLWVGLLRVRLLRVLRRLRLSLVLRIGLGAIGLSRVLRILRLARHDDEQRCAEPNHRNRC